jgi:hypothetical protein
MQEQKEDTLIKRLKEMMQHVDSSSVTQEELVQAEAQLGFALPVFVRRLYSEVGDGGFAGRLRKMAHLSPPLEGCRFFSFPSACFPH